MRPMPCAAPVTTTTRSTWFTDVLLRSFRDRAGEDVLRELQRALAVVLAGSAATLDALEADDADEASPCDVEQRPRVLPSQEPFLHPKLEELATALEVLVAEPVELGLHAFAHLTEQVG